VDYRELMKDALVIDSHNDTIVAHIRRGNLSVERGEEGASERHSGTIAFLRGHEDPRPGAAYLQINFPLMRQAGIDVGFFAIDVTLAFQNHLAYALDGFGYFLADIAASGADAAIVRQADDIIRAKADGKLAAVLALEHADCTERSLNVLWMLYQLGVRSIGLTHNVSSWAADGCLEGRQGTGLTRFGVALVQEMNRLGMLVDLAHVSEGAFFHALDVSTKPVIFSHGNARALCDHPRNLTDDQLRALRDNGGVIGLSYVPDFVDARNPSIERLLDHVDHVAEVAGIETVGLGGDFDGGGTLLADATETPKLVDGLLRRGYSEPDARKVLGENTLRVLRAAIG
jgi:membrane dipeptidase